MKSTLLLMAIAAIAVALRFSGLSAESLWFDEGLMYQRISGSYFAALMHWDLRWQGVLFAMIEKAWCDVFGHSEFALRFLPALFGSLAIPAMYSLGRRVFSSAAGLLSALLLAINPFAINYSQDARPYSLFLLLGIVSTDWAIRSVHSEGRRSRLLFVVFATLCMYSHPFGVFLLPFYVTIPFLVSSGRLEMAAIRRYGMSVVMIVAAYLPMVVLFSVTLIGKMAGQLHDADFIAMPGAAVLPSTVSQYFMSSPAAILAGVTILAALALHAYRGRMSKALLIPVSLAACLMLAPWIVSHVLTPIYVYRYTTPALAAVVLMTGWAAATVPVPVRVGVMAMFVISSTLVLSDYYTKIDKDPWRQTADILRPRLEAGDLVVVNPAVASQMMHYYKMDVYPAELYAPKDTTGLRERVQMARRVWVVTGDDVASELRSAIQQAAEDARVHEFSVDVRDTLIVDPHALAVSDIHLNLYRRK